MTFIASFNCFFLWFYQMRNKYCVVDLRMAFYASHIFKVQLLIREPFMLLKDIYFLPVG